MTTAVVRDRDQRLKTDVEEELAWRPEIDAARIVVVVEEGTVVLSGEVRDYAERVAVKDAVLRVRGVVALVDDLFMAEPEDPPDDQALAAAVRDALDAAGDVPTGVHADVQHGTVVLTGQVAFDVERRAAKHVVRFLRGVRAVDNRIEVARKPSAADAVTRIENALRRNAIVDAHRITVRLDGDTLILGGTARSWAERAQAAESAAASPHVAHVDNNIVVHPS